MPVEGTNTKANPWPGRKFLKGAMEKMKEVEKGSTKDELDDLVAIFEGCKALPIEKVSSLVRARIEDWIVALP